MRCAHPIHTPCAGFAIAPDDLIKLAKNFLVSRGGFGADPELLSPAFQFIAPVVGPLGKEEVSHTVIGPSLSFGRNNWSAPESLLTHTHTYTQ